MKDKLYWDQEFSKFYDLGEGTMLPSNFAKVSPELTDGKFFVHPLGFPIFLRPNQISQEDEYAQGDPYQVEGSLESEFHQRRMRLTLELVSEVAQPGARILDLGCGEGHITAKVAESVRGEIVCGTDYSIAAITKAATKFPSLELCVCDARRMLPYPKHYFDVVLCNNLWEHLPDPAVLLKEANRVLKFSGHLLLSTPSRFRLDNIINLMRGRPLQFMSPYHVTEYTVGQVIEQLRYHRFEVCRVVSQPLKTYSGVKGFLRAKVIKGSLALGARIAGVPPVSLESTVFYLARSCGVES